MICFVLILAVCQGILADWDPAFHPYVQKSNGQSYQYSYASALDSLRNLTDLWEADTNPSPTVSYRTGLRLDLLKKTRLPVGVLAVDNDLVLPETFDARDKWPQCSSLRRVRDQGCCGSCWAVSATEAMTDRWCVNSDTSDEFTFGATDLMACCHRCGNGCQGGVLGPAWDFWVETGLSSGGPYNSRKGCHPYPISTCRVPGQLDDTPKCSFKCQPNHNVTYVSEDRRFGRVAYSVPNNEERIKEEIFRYGPVQAAFRVYWDFQFYKRGIYRHVLGPQTGGHAVKVLGWGVERGVKYWLVANSWGAEWGEKGYFKIVRGENHCGFEEDVHAGLPHYTKHLQNPKEDW